MFLRSHILIVWRKNPLFVTTLISPSPFICIHTMAPSFSIHSLSSFLEEPIAWKADRTKSRLLSSTICTTNDSAVIPHDAKRHIDLSWYTWEIDGIGLRFGYQIAIYIRVKTAADLKEFIDASKSDNSVNNIIRKGLVMYIHISLTKNNIT